MGVGFVARAQVVTIGRVFFGLGLIGMGGQHYFFRQFVPMVVPMWPAWMPARMFWVCLVGTILIVCGGAILAGVKAAWAGMVAGALFLASFLFLHIPLNLTLHVTSLGGWTTALKAFAFAGSSFAVAGVVAGAEAYTDGISAKARGRSVFYGMMPFAMMLIAFGIDHFLYAAFIATVVPAYIPGHVFWTYFAGVALIASGVGMFVKPTARLAATLLGAMLLAWVFMLHLPRAFADPYGLIGNEWTSVFQALALSGVAFMLSEVLGGEDEAASAAGPHLLEDRLTFTRRAS